MSKFSIEWSEVKKTGTTNGKDWKITTMTLKDEMGTMHDNVSTFDPVMTGGSLEGEIITNEKGYKNFKNHIQRPSNPMFNKTAQMEKVMDRKEESITKFADRKEEAIAMAGAQRDAVLIVTSKILYAQPIADDTVKLEILKWRNWLLSDEFKKGIPPF